MSLVTVTAGQILYQAYRYAGVLRGPMRGLSGSEQQEGIITLNSILDAYKADRAAVYVIARILVPINANQQQYTIGQDVSAGLPDWLMERPEKIERAGFIYTNVSPNIEVPFEILTEQQWAAVSPKDLTSTIPYMFYYQPFVPNGIVNLWPVPTQGWQAALYLWTTLSQVAGTDDVMNMPPAYNDLLAYGLAMRLTTMYPQFSNPVLMSEIRTQFMAAKQRVRQINFPQLLATCEVASLGIHGNDHFGLRYDPISNTYH